MRSAKRGIDRETIENALRTPDEVILEESVVRLHKTLSESERLVVYVVEKHDGDVRSNLVITVWIEHHADT